VRGFPTILLFEDGEERGRFTAHGRRILSAISSRSTAVSRFSEFSLGTLDSRVDDAG